MMGLLVNFVEARNQKVKVSVPRKTTRAINRFIRQSIKIKSQIDCSELDKLLDELSAEELHCFWKDFWMNLAFASTLGVPHWMTRKQESRFKDTLESHAFRRTGQDSACK